MLCHLTISGYALSLQVKCRQRDVSETTGIEMFSGQKCHTFDPSGTVVTNDVDAKWKLTVDDLYWIVEMLYIPARVQCVD